ncbi:potassium transporter [Pseudoalteromonas sp. SCSIO_11900]|uniref:TrkH family potassium uptake protein n=1 Tax=Pseudoalteromonas sp. SCSIO_11900 TaxID=1461766 RepID=UPI00044B74F4|nr:potassium transporter TrkG [Pseudoalteromonas sp. SCSIO_11900]EWS96449.1 potassium transporter [Pseudoalteromonas sp. SCSIO_11900]
MINWRVTLRLLAFPIIWMASVQLIFAALSLFVFKDRVVTSFIAPGASLFFIALLLLINLRKANLAKANFRDALIYATITWAVIGILGAIPIILVTDVSIVDGIFESISGLTTTGATILSDLDGMPPTFLLYRQFLQWMGGLGIVIFVVAILPMLNVGGMKLLKAETPGPIKDEKLTPRVASTAHYLWGVYLTITLLCTLAYYVGGMSFYDAIAHAFTTVSTGGFSTHDASMWYYQSHLLLWISNLFMIAGAVNFGLHFRVAHKRSIRGYYDDEETRYFIYIIMVLTALLTSLLLLKDTYTNTLEAFSFSMFHIISFITSTGFGAAGYTDWPPVAGFLLVFVGYLGGCAGSTAGGNKIIRNIIVAKIINLNIKQTIHPRAIFTIKYQGISVTEDIRHAIMAFMTFAAGSSLLFTLLLMATGLDFWSAFTAVAACVNVLGPGFGEVGSNFQPVTDTGTLILSIAMIVGRLEYFTVFALFTRTFWQK